VCFLETQTLEWSGLRLYTIGLEVAQQRNERHGGAFVWRSFTKERAVADDAERGTMPGGTGGRTKRRAGRRGEVGSIRRVGVGVVITQEGSGSSSIELNGMYEVGGWIIGGGSW